ncbi:Uncharacterised protein [Yersinia frederiksenii]|uniref:hypothetical protein n=1 Tax=Yersinia alsatica TaxID=2890317 RepID=UPI0005E56B05|nr:hypothetical protein [Yersinia alsatica]OWF81115.1 hypothetical protein B4903_08345 [Yersinia frederiksenii]CFQ63087.1 Uncharacterised protein [Yersinia frederiksenii]CND35577.1 Uncharacterised protein [Yersinia frederiksenii]CNI04206.1 Uncharacterised protein [Yersinia frederiksenii]CNI62226.1 Uncharacterised protein [Yersinia frederiksenii]
MHKILAFTLLGTTLISTGCTSPFHSAPVYQDPVGEGNNIARIRFVSNVTGTSIKAKEDNIDRELVPHTALGFYNDTRDISMPKLSYRQQDYKSYYFEVRVKPQPIIISITTDATFRGQCQMSVLFTPEAGKDYDVNFDTGERIGKCIFHLNQIVTDPSTSVAILKPVQFKKVSTFVENPFE